jgi:anti-anti-sigma factor
VSVHTRQRPVALLQLGIIVAERGTTTVIELDGEWNLAARHAVHAAIRRVLARRPSCVVLDLSRVSSIDASGVRVVVELARRSELEHVHFVIIPGPPAVQHAFAHCRVADELPFVAHGIRPRATDRLASTLRDRTLAILPLATGGPGARDLRVHRSRRREEDSWLRSRRQPTRLA